LEEREKMATALPTFKGLTVDMRLKQFRRMDTEKGIEFIDFDSKKGTKLLTEYHKTISQT